jgi:lysophospholipase L1-like esterase
MGAFEPSISLPRILRFLACAGLFALSAAGALPMPAQDGQQTRAKTSTSLTDIFYLGDSYLDDGNLKAILGRGPAWYSNGPPWGTMANRALHLPTAARWATTANNHPIGNNYAVCAAGITLPPATSLSAQIAKLQADYPQGIPASSLVVIAIGTNDIRQAIIYGGLWSYNSAGWTLASEGFVVPPVGQSVTVQVINTTGMGAGTDKLVAFPIDSNTAIMMAVTAFDAGTRKVTLTTVLTVPGATISANAQFQVWAKWYLDTTVTALAAGINSIVTNHGKVILALLEQCDLLPTFNRKPNEALVRATWKYLYDQMLTLAPKNGEDVLAFDLNSVFQDVYYHPSQYGFKFNYPGWSSSSPHPDEFMFWDDLHPSGAMHKCIASRFLQFLRERKLGETK